MGRDSILVFKCSENHCLSAWYENPGLLKRFIWTLTNSEKHLSYYSALARQEGGKVGRFL